MLIDNTLFGLVDKVDSAIDLLKEYEPPEGYYVCFSGGKDSVVTYDLVKRAGVKFDAHHAVTNVEPPELIQFIKQHYPEVENQQPKLTMSQLIQKHGIPPLRTARYCCSQLKETYGKGRLKVTGIRTEESSRRAKRNIYEPDTKNGGAFLHIIRDWQSKDVWQYIHENNLPYCKLYDEDYTRIGCVMCCFADHAKMQRDMKRYPQIAEYYRRACIKAFNLHKNRDKPLNKWESGEDMFNWWIGTWTQNRIAEDCQLIPLFSEDDGYVL